MNYIVDCPECGEELELEEDAAQLEKEDGLIVECVNCGVETDFKFSDFEEVEYEDGDDDDEPDPLTGEIEDLEEDDNEPTD